MQLHLTMKCRFTNLIFYVIGLFMLNKLSHLILLLICTQLSGCIGILLASASTTGVIISDSRDFKTSQNDQSMRHQIYLDIIRDPDLKSSNITVACFHGIILLTGQVPNSMLKVKAEKIAKLMPDISRVYNEITVSDSIDIKTQSNDVWITTKVKSKLVTTPGLKSGSVKVVTENGAVYLMGIVTQKQADVLVETTRKISGVKRVVKAFKYFVVKDEKQSKNK